MCYELNKYGSTFPSRYSATEAISEATRSLPRPPASPPVPSPSAGRDGGRRVGERRNSAWLVDSVWIVGVLAGGAVEAKAASGEIKLLLLHPLFGVVLDFVEEQVAFAARRSVDWTSFGLLWLAGEATPSFQIWELWFLRPCCCGTGVFSGDGVGSGSLYRRLCCARSSSFVAGEGGDVRSPVVLRLDASSMCWFVWTEVDDFPSAEIPSADVKVTPAPGGSGGGGAAARRQLASMFVLGRLLRDPVVISVLHGVLCTTGFPY